MSEKMPNKPKSRVATATKVFSVLIIIVLGVVGLIVGLSMADIGNDTEEVLFPTCGAGIGLLVGFLIMLVLLNLSELGTNVKKTAEATIETAKADATEKLKEYKELLDSGAITQAEFDAKKQEILNSDK